MSIATTRPVIFVPRLVLAAALLIAPGCDDSPATRNVSLRFAARAGATPVSCAGHYDLGAPPSQVRLQDFRLYVSNLRLVDDTGTEHPITLLADGKWQSDSVALLDFEDGTGACGENTSAETNTVVTGLTTSARSAALRFTLGVPPPLNHQLPSSAVSPLTVGAMFWSWQAGYKFIRLDLEQTTMPGSSWLVHVGSTGCQSSVQTEPPATACGRSNRAEITLAPFDPERNQIVVDIAALLAASNLASNTAATAPGCMSTPEDPECVGVFERLGLDFATGACVNGCSGQSFFRVE